MKTKQDFIKISRYINEILRQCNNEYIIDFNAKVYYIEYEASIEMDTVSPIMQLMCEEIREDMDFQDYETEQNKIRNVKELEQIITKILDDIGN